ncbi:MAG TPA: pitrilysin family protein [Edaphocola sp.]|nr:pitrilysin family protein [Edaphocola sp.]
MINFEEFELKNGLKVLVHHDSSTPVVAINILYNVGARDENESKTGFAHLFEHLMFGGSINIPSYDEPLQVAGGENNAYTTNDFTNYYVQIPKENIETALWLESDRMLSLAFSKKSLDVQRKVVSEEFKEHYINKPYGDAWKHLRALSYVKHPYKWMTIGKELSHIEEAQLEDVKAFFKKHYNPSNAIMCIAGNITLEEVEPLVVKWFGDIPKGETYHRNLPLEPQQKAARKLIVYEDVPLNAIYKSWHIGDRLSNEYHISDILTEILGTGKTSRLYQKLVKELQFFSNINCYHTGSLEAGLLVINGKIVDGIGVTEADNAIKDCIKDLIENGITEIELEKSVNRIESMVAFEDMNLLARANNLAYFKLLGDPNMMNTEMKKYEQLTILDIHNAVKNIFAENNCNTLFYLKKK